jgi:YVTN family beta-propeller protein
VWDAATFRLIQEVPVGKGAYNVEPSPDGKVVIVTNKKDQSVSIIDAATMAEVARIPTSKKVVHGVAYIRRTIAWPTSAASRSGPITGPWMSSTWAAGNELLQSPSRVSRPA